MQQHVGKLRCIHFQFQRKCLLHSHVAFCKSNQSENAAICFVNQIVHLVAFLNSTQYTDDRSCVESAWFPSLLSVGMQQCAVETGVIQAVSGSCDLKHPAQQLETTYIAQLPYETSDSTCVAVTETAGNTPADSGISNEVNRAQDNTLHQNQ